MNEFLVYLLKVAAAIALVTLPYFLVLRNDANLLVKRIYLAGGILLSWIFPLLSVRKPDLVTTMNPVFVIDPGTATSNAAIQAPATPDTGITLLSVIALLYLAGILVFCILNMNALFRLRKDATRSSGPRNILHTKSEKVFTVFPNIYLPEKYKDTAETTPILIHERAHIRQLHVADLLISEISLALTWFNPFSWLISRMIKENHEHLADREVLSQGVKPAHYKAMLLNHALGGEVFRFGHQFNHSLTKKRFNMMKKMKAPKKGIFKYILFVPAILAFTLMATAASQKDRVITGKVYLETTKNPATGATVLVSGSTVGTVVDRKGEFQLDVTGNPQLTVSFVGYETESLSANEIEKKPLILVPAAYEIPLAKVKNPKPEEYTVEVIVEKSGGKEKFTVKSDEGSFTTKDDEDVVYVIDGKESKTIEHLDADEIEQVRVYKGADNEMVKKHNAKSGVIMVTTKKSAGKQVPDQKKYEVEEKEVSASANEEIFYVVEDIPSYPGGMDALGAYIEENLEYPAKAKQKEIAGKVMVEMKVKADGTLSDIRVSQSSNNIFNDAALEIFADMPDWNPGKQRGKPVSCKVIVPVRFNPSQE